MKNKINIFLTCTWRTDTQTPTHTNTHAHTTLRGCLRVAADPTSQELQRTILSLAFLQLCLPRLRLVCPQDPGNPRTDSRNPVEQRPEKRSDRCCHMCTQVLRTDLHAQNVSPERFRTVQPAFFCVNGCVNFRVNFRQVFGDFGSLSMFQCRPDLLPRTRNRQPRAREPFRGTVATKRHAPEPF